MKDKRLWAAAFAAYCLMMLWLLFDRPGYHPGTPYREQLKYNLVPFETIGLFLRMLSSGGGGNRTHAAINLVGNVVMFLPLGFCIPKLWPSQGKLWRVIAVTVAVITVVELMQMLTLVGSFDTDDLLLNTLGSTLGYGLHRLWK